MVIVIRCPQQQSPGTAEKTGSLSSTSTTASVHYNSLVAGGNHKPHALLFAKRHGHDSQLWAHAVGHKGAGKRNGQGNVSDGHRIFLT